MSIQVICGSCLRQYQVPDDWAGRRVRCKACQGEMRIEAPEPVEDVFAVAGEGPPELPPPLPPAMPPPLPPALGTHPSQSFAPKPYPSRAYPAPSTAGGGSARMVIGIIAGGIVLAFIVFGAVGYRLRASNSAMFMSSATIEAKMVGDWRLIKSPNNFTTADFTFRPDGTSRLRILNGSTLADLNCRWSLDGKVLTLTISGINFGNQSAVGKTIGLGRVKQISDTSIVMSVQGGEEVYQRATAALPASLLPSQRMHPGQ